MAELDPLGTEGAPLPPPPPDPSPESLPLPGDSGLIEQVFSGLDSPVPLAWGRHIVGGTLVYQQESGSDVIMIYALGAGEWDELEWLEVNGGRFNHLDTTRVHFHPGLDGEVGAESSPGTRNQKFCSLLPAGFSPATHWPRTAYLALKLPPDPEAPTEGFTVRASYKCLRVRAFDNTGAETAYAYSANPAWCALDAILRAYLLPHANIDEALPTAVKDRFDWAAWKDWADACDFDIGGGINRWEAHLPFVRQSDLKAALEWFLLVGRAYLVEKNGKLAPFHDESRASVATYDAGDFMPGTLNLARKSMRNRPNRFKVAYRDLDSGIGPGTIDSASTALTGTGTDFARRLQAAKMVRLLDGAQAGEVRGIVSVADDTNAVLDSAFSAAQSGAAYESPNDAYQQQTRQFDDENHQDQVARVITAALDLGNSTPERAERLLTHRRGRAALSLLLSGRLHFGAADADDLLPGDVVTLPADQEFGAMQEIELLDVTVEPDFAVTLAGQEFDSSIFTDAAGDQEDLSPTLTPTLDNGLTRAAQALRTDLTYADPRKYHDSGVRGETTSNVGGSTANSSFATVDSYTRKLSPGSSQFQCTLNVLAGTTVGDSAAGRIKIGSQLSAEVIALHPGSNPKSEAVTVTGLTGGSVVTVEVQARVISGGASAQADFDRVDPSYDDESHWSA